VVVRCSSTERTGAGDFRPEFGSRVPAGSEPSVTVSTTAYSVLSASRMALTLVCTSSILQLHEISGPISEVRLLHHAYFDYHPVSFCMATTFSKHIVAVVPSMVPNVEQVLKTSRDCILLLSLSSSLSPTN
jgi:hypothetical protein